jgi:hypothetical protein
LREINHSYLVAAETRDIGERTIWADQNLLRPLADLDGADLL